MKIYPNMAIEKSPVNEGFSRKIAYQWWIFQQAMFDCRSVPTILSPLKGETLIL